MVRCINISPSKLNIYNLNSYSQHFARTQPKRRNLDYTSRNNCNLLYTTIKNVEVDLGTSEATLIAHLLSTLIWWLSVHVLVYTSMVLTSKDPIFNFQKVFYVAML